MMKAIIVFASVGFLGLLVAGLTFAVNGGNASDLVSFQKPSNCNCTTCCSDGDCCCGTGVCKCDSCQCDCCNSAGVSCNLGCCSESNVAPVSSPNQSKGCAGGCCTK